MDDLLHRARAMAAAPPEGRRAILPIQPGVPAFRAEDARAYAAHDRIPGGVAKGVRVRDVQFLTSSDLSMRLKVAGTGLAGAAQVCLVELEGDFAFMTPRGSAAHDHRAYEVFDARTGNLMMAGALASDGQF